MIEIFKDVAGKWRFRIKTREGDILVSSEPYDTPDSASTALGDLKTMLCKDWATLEFNLIED